MLRLDFRTNNNTFGDGANIEAGRILREVAGKIEDGVFSGFIRDYNGRVIGEFELQLRGNENEEIMA